MAGGVAILLVVLVALVVAAIALALYATGGFAWWRKTDARGDRLEGDDEPAARPQHTEPQTPAQRRTRFVGGDDD